MFVVETISKPRFISGVFISEIEANKCYIQPGKSKVLRQTSVFFPFYIIEEARNSGNHFRYVNQTQILRVLRNIVRIPDHEHTYLNVYYVFQEFRVKKLGADEMGKLAHRHVNNDWLKKFDDQGESLIVEMD